MNALPSFDEITETFDLLDDWEERYRYLIDLGKALPPLPDEARTAQNKVPGCVSQVWLDMQAEGDRLHFRGDSDAHIVKGLVALLIALHSGQPAADILATDTVATFRRFGLDAHLTPQRSNGFRSMVERIRSDARGLVSATNA